MSSDVPGSGAGGAGGQEPGVDYLGDAQQESGGRKKWPIVAGGALVTAGLVGAAAWGVTSFLADGSSPAQAVPASALAYLSIDIDPGGGQQLAAYQTLKKFPALEEELGLDQDLRKTLIDAIKEEEGCEDLDYEDDIEPWLGDSVGFGVLDGDEEPMPFFVVEVTDQGAAESGVETLFACGSESGEPEDIAWDFNGDYMIAAENDDNVARVISETEEASLADDETYQARVDDVGGVGFITGYASPAASEALLDEALSSADSLASGSTSLSEDPFAEPDSGAMSEEEQQVVRDAFEGFDGAAMSLRFEDEGMEVNVSAAGITTDGLSQGFQGGDSGVTELPATTIAAYGFPIGDDLVQSYIDFAGKLMDEDELQQEIDSFEQSTGLTTEDLQTMLGDGITLSLDSSADWSGVFSGATPPTEIPAGLRIKGDPAEIRPLVEQALTTAGAPPGAVTIDEGDGVLTLSFSPEYAATLTEDGGLGSNAAFESVFPDLEADEATFFLSFEGDWLAGIAESLGGSESEQVRENVEPLQAVGVVGTANDEGIEYSLRVTTD